MSCLSSSKKASIRAKITKLESQLEIANTTLDAALGNEIAEYRFDSGEGSQRTQYKSIDDLKKNIDWLESRINYYQRKLTGAGLSSLNLRRKSCIY